MRCISAVRGWVGVVFRPINRMKFRKTKVTCFQRRVLCAIYAAVIYHVWMNRNTAIWKGFVNTPQHVLGIIQMSIRDRFKALYPSVTDNRIGSWMHFWVVACVLLFWYGLLCYVVCFADCCWSMSSLMLILCCYACFWWWLLVFWWMLDLVLPVCCYAPCLLIFLSSWCSCLVVGCPKLLLIVWFAPLKLLLHYFLLCTRHPAVPCCWLCLVSSFELLFLLGLIERCWLLCVLECYCSLMQTTGLWIAADLFLECYCKQQLCCLLIVLLLVFVCFNLYAFDALVLFV